MNNFVFPLAAIAPIVSMLHHVMCALIGARNKLITYKHHRNMAGCKYEQTSRCNKFA